MKGVHQRFFGRSPHPWGFLLLLFSPQLDVRTLACPLFAFAPRKRQLRSSFLHFIPRSGSQHTHWIPQLVYEPFSFSFCFQGVVGVFAGESTFTSSTSFLCLIKEGVFSWALALLEPTSSLPIIFFLNFHGACLIASSTESFRLWAFSS